MPRTEDPQPPETTQQESLPPYVEKAQKKLTALTQKLLIVCQQGRFFRKYGDEPIRVDNLNVDACCNHGEFHLHVAPLQASFPSLKIEAGVTETRQGLDLQTIRQLRPDRLTIRYISKDGSFIAQREEWIALSLRQRGIVPFASTYFQEKAVTFYMDKTLRPEATVTVVEDGTFSLSACFGEEEGRMIAKGARTNTKREKLQKVGTGESLAKAFQRQREFDFQKSEWLEKVLMELLGRNGETEIFKTQEFITATIKELEDTCKRYAEQLSKTPPPRRS